MNLWPNISRDNENSNNKYPQKRKIASHEAFCIRVAINMQNIVKKIASLYAHTKKNTKVFWFLIGLIVVSGIIATYISLDIIINIALQHLTFLFIIIIFHIFWSSCEASYYHFSPFCLRLLLSNGMFLDKNTHTSHTLNSTLCTFIVYL